MTLPVIAIRPEPGLTATVAAGREGGLPIEGFALFTIEPVAWRPPDPEHFDGLLLGSASALRHGGGALSLYRGKPAFVVGEMTARAARAAGLDVVLVGEGGLQQVLDRLTGRNLRLLRLAGRDHVRLTAPDGIDIETVIAYAAAPLPMPAECAARLRGQAVVLLHSAAAARHFAAECDRLDLARSRIRLAALGPRIAEGAGGGWAELRSAARPRDSALLALAGEMCQETGEDANARSERRDETRPA